MRYVYQQIESFTSTNLTDTFNDWSPSTTYSFESGTPTNSSVARYGTYYYRSVINSNINNNPEEFERVKWTKYGVSNKYAMLDLSSQSKSIYIGGNLTVTFLQNRMDTLGIGNYEASTVTVEILADNGISILWTYTTHNVGNIGVTNWWTYIYSPYGYEVDRATKIDLPTKGKYVRVTFNKSTESDRTSCGYLVGGESIDMGKTLSDVSFSFNSFALKETDEWGALIINKRAVQDIVDFETIIPTNEMVNFKRKIKSVYNDIILFIVDESVNSEYENLLTLGVIQDASVVLTEFDKTTMTFSVIESV